MVLEKTHQEYATLLCSSYTTFELNSNNQGSTDHTTFTYNADDSVASISDARVATKTFMYNGRGLVTHVGYTAPTINAPGSSIVVPAAVDIDYDAVGNRNWMNEGGQRRVTYHYSELSQMDWEERHFPGLTGTNPYRLNYEYNLSGQVKKVTDQTSNTSFSTSYDAIGRESGVSAVGFGSVNTTFATGFQYRAWGAVKSITYGNGTTLNTSYDSRRQLTDYNVSGLRQSWGVPPPAPFTVGTSLQYFDDGRQKFAGYQNTSWVSTADLQSEDRAYGYDHAGRLKTGYSGLEAHNLVGDLNSGAGVGPYRHSFAFDGWNNVLTADQRYWSRSYLASATFNSQNRNPDWSYDAEGNVTTRNEGYPDGTSPARFAYDAAGNQSSSSQTVGYYDYDSNESIILSFNNTQSYDGDGWLTTNRKEESTNSSSPAVDLTFYLRSTVLGGASISEYDGSGVFRRGHVYVGGQLVGDQENFFGAGRSVWRHQNPVTGDELNSLSNGDFIDQMLSDPQGVNVSGSDPFPQDGSGVQDGTNHPSSLAGIDTWFPFPMDGHRVTCELDGVLVDCQFARFLEGHSAVRCPSNDCGPRVLRIDVTFPWGEKDSASLLTDPFSAYADGSSGFGFFGMLLPEGTRIKLTGNEATEALLDAFSMNLKRKGKRRRNKQGIQITNYGPVTASQFDIANRAVNEHYSSCRNEVFGAAVVVGSRNIPSADATLITLAAGMNDADIATRVAGVFSQESNFQMNPGDWGKDAGPAQLTGAVLKYWPGALVGNAFGSRYSFDRKGRPGIINKGQQDGDVLDNLATLRNIVLSYASDYKAAYAYGPGPAKYRVAYAKEVEARTPTYRLFFNCVLR